MSDLFEKFNKSMGPLGKWASIAEGYFVFPKLEGKISNRMKFNGREVITWSVNDYLGLSNHPEVRKIDSEAAEKYGSAYPMGARMMSGHTSMHEKLENQLADFVNKESAYVLNFGYQGILSIVDTLVSKNDVIVYDVGLRNMPIVQQVSNYTCCSLYMGCVETHKLQGSRIRQDRFNFNAIHRSRG